MRKLIFLTIATAASLTLCNKAKAVDAADCTVAAINTAITNTAAGGTVNVPTCTGTTWTTTLNITKNINLIGKTTTNTTSQAGSANDQTVIIDGLADRSIPLLKWNNVNDSNTARLSGFTFRSGPVFAFTQDAEVRMTGLSHNVRIDHNHFDMLYG